MTKEQEEAIEGLKNLSPSESDIETVLNMLKEKEKENRELMDEYHKKVQEVIDLEQDIKILQDDFEDKRLVYIDTPEFQDSYIPKQAVIDKIKELDIAILECEYDDDDVEEYKNDVEKEKKDIINKKSALEELLEEK